MLDQLLGLNIVSGPVPTITYALAILALGYLVFRRPTRRWLWTLAGAILAGLLIGVIVLQLTENVWKLFGGPIGMPARVWSLAAFVGISIAVVNLWRSRWWRKAIAVMGVILFGLSATLGINAAFGLNPTLGSFLHIVSDKPIDLEKPKTEGETPALPLYKTWKAPADMPALGSVGTRPIPGTISGFKARPAGIYLPPAAQVPNPPALPLVVMMMGQPGDPTPSFIQQVLDNYAVQHEGLAPIVVVADQIGNPNNDTLCLDTATYGNVETYITQDVVNWAKENLNIIQDPAYWTVAGYSNGGECSIYFGAKYPDTFRNIIDISGEEYQGTGNPARVLKDIFAGNQAAYDAVKPLTILAKNRYPHSNAIFTYGGNDPGYAAQAAKVEAAAKAAGMTTRLAVVPGAGHGADALVGGLKEGFSTLYPVLGLSAPPE